MRGKDTNTSVEPRIELSKRFLNIESNGGTYQFLEILPETPSDTLILSFPGFAVDGAEECEADHIGREQRYVTVGLRAYGDIYSRDALLNAVSSIIKSIGQEKKVILHGTSFGGGVVYDFISDPNNRDFLRRNKIVIITSMYPIITTIILCYKPLIIYF